MPVEAKTATVVVAPQPSPLVIREPQGMEDLKALHMLMLLHGEEGAEAPVNPAKVMAKLVDAAQNLDRATMLMAIQDGRLVGYLCIEVVEFWYSDDLFLADFGMYVLPAFRNTGAGVALKRVADSIAEGAGMMLKIHRQDRHRRKQSVH